MKYWRGQFFRIGFVFIFAFGFFKLLEFRFGWRDLVKSELAVPSKSRSGSTFNDVLLFRIEATERNRCLTVDGAVLHGEQRPLSIVGNRRTRHRAPRIVVSVFKLLLGEILLGVEQIAEKDR